MESVLTLHYVGIGDQTQVTGLGSTHLHLMNHLVGPKKQFKIKHLLALEETLLLFFLLFMTR